MNTIMTNWPAPELVHALRSAPCISHYGKAMLAQRRKKLKGWQKRRSR